MDKTTLINIFKRCLDIMRGDGGFLIGHKALNNLSYLLILKLLEPQFKDDIKIDKYEYNFNEYEDSAIETTKKHLLKIVMFSNLSKENEDNICKNINILWDCILSVHPSTKNVFLKGKGFDIKDNSTFKKIINIINSIDLSQVKYDILGNAYEEVIQDFMTGKVLGQFFTQPLIKKMMVKLINPQIRPDGKIDSCCDPTMGTGGFLITYLKTILEEAKAKGIELDWDFIKNEGLYGKEIEPDTYQMAVSNMLISSGHMFEKLERGDSIRDPITRKFDNILANPPFGIKELKYKDFPPLIKKEYVPIKTNNATFLFIQAIIHILKIDGKCAVVLPDGKELFSKTKSLAIVREYLMKTCDLKEIIYLPSDIFTYTSIKTCVFYFVKKKECSDILKLDIKNSKTTGVETKRNYTFKQTHETNKVKFYDYNPYEDVKNLLVEVPIEKIISNSYSLNYTEYMKDETEEKYEEGVVLKTLGEICKFLPKSKRNAKYGTNEGLYPFYTSSQNCTKYCDECDYEDECLIIGTGGSANIKYSNKFSCSIDNLIVKIDTEQLTKYIYYYILLNIEVLQKGFAGAAIQHISKEYVKNIKIPIPSLELQKEIIKYLDFIYENANRKSNEKIDDLKRLNKSCLHNQNKFGDNVTKTLGEICKFLPKSQRNAKHGSNEGPYPFYTSSQNCTKYCDECDYEDECLIIGTGGSANIKYSNKFSCSIDNLIVKIDTEQLTKYIYYYILLNIEVLQKGFTGAALQHISKEYVKNIKIPIPSLECQKEIVMYCEHNDLLIKQLEKEIENNKRLTRQFIKNVIKRQVQIEE